MMSLPDDVQPDLGQPGLGQPDPTRPDPTGPETVSANIPDAEHTRPAGLSDATVEALGKYSEALEVLEDARGSLYRFHRLTGKADLAMGEAVELFRAAGHDDIADDIEERVVGRNVLEGRWTFQIMEEYDDGYYATVKASERAVREQLAGGRRHLFEAEMKERERTQGRRHHEARPPAAHEGHAGPEGSPQG